jgi:hypothetical protein
MQLLLWKNLFQIYLGKENKEQLIKQKRNLDKDIIKISEKINFSNIKFNMKSN